MKNKSLISGLIIFSLLILSCSNSQRGPKSGKKAASSKTGWAYNDRDWGGFEVNLKYKKVFNHLLKVWYSLRGELL